MSHDLPSILRCPSPDRWLEKSLTDLDTLLHDHAHCEQKAASSVMALVFRSPDSDRAMALSRMAREELTHFEMALRELRRREVTFGRLQPAAYAARLATPVRRKDPSHALADSLIVCALIEARSHERMHLLAGAVDDPELQSFYHALSPAEDRHWRLMLELLGDPAPWQDRIDLFADFEARLIADGEDLIRMHA